MGASWAKLGNMDGARHVYELAVLLDPDSPHAKANLGAMYLRMQRPMEALIACDAALVADPKNLTALVNRAATLNSLERYPEAAEAAEKALNLDRMNPHSYLRAWHRVLENGQILESTRLCQESSAR